MARTGREDGDEMKRPPQLFVDIEAAGGRVLESGEDGCRFILPWPITNVLLCCIASWGRKWDHVSIHAEQQTTRVIPKVTIAMLTPTWDQMALVKQVCFMPTEWALQYHPGEPEYVNHHKHVLHIWKPQTKHIPKPPKEFV